MNPAQHAVVIVAFAGALGAAVACNRTPPTDRPMANELEDKSGAPAGASMTTVTGAEFGAMSSDAAVDRIVSARCARESACEKTTGSDRRLTDPAICKQRLGERVGMDLRPNDCPRGVDSAALATCLQSISGESCSNPAETIQRLAACRTHELCLKTSDGR